MQIRRHLRPLVAATFATGLLGAGAASATAQERELGTSLAQGAQAAPANLKTQFEQSGGKEFTTYNRAFDYLRELDQSTEKVAVTSAGRSLRGRRILQVTVGSPAPKSVDDAAKGSVAMLVCSVHGNEQAGREACMKLARDLAYSESPAVRRLLERTTIAMVMPNPDGWVANTRGNAEGTDVNRDYVAGKTPEARAVLRLVTSYKPDLLNDLHEYGPRKHYNTELMHLWPRNRNVDRDVYGLAKTISQDYAAAEVVKGGFSAGIYGQLVKDGEPYRQIAGDGQARILRNYVGLRNVVGMLTETADEALNDAEAADPARLNNRRVTVNYTAAVGSLELIAERPDELAEQTTAADKRQAERGAKGAGVLYFGGQDDMLPTDPAQTEDMPACGYRISAETRDKFRGLMRLHGVGSYRSGDSFVVPMGQATRGLIPLLFDKRSPDVVAEGEPVPCAV